MFRSIYITMVAGEHIEIILFETKYCDDYVDYQRCMPEDIIKALATTSKKGAYRLKCVFKKGAEPCENSS